MKNIVVAVMGVFVIAVSAWGFGGKLWELVLIVRQWDSGSSEGAFAVTPLVNYLLATFGFLLMLFWAAANGMFTEIERPKQTMLDREEQLDEGHVEAHYADSVTLGKKK
ncbi:MAG: hypothetical protein KF688_16880 [Pirellulales bacterium]|nr:hypothetical protein [Pirellulales bacterium]MBX3433820.1 hypothetical protein [Pirellulales bacterium]